MNADLRKLVVPLTIPALLAALPLPASAQLISLRTAPVATGEQYVVLPSETFGMGGAGIALRDALADPFSNPATGARLRGMHAFAAPTFYSVHNVDGGGRTLTSGLLGRSGRAFGGVALSLQEVSDPTSQRIFATPEAPTGTRSSSSSFVNGNPSNRYVNALGGFALGNRKTSFGAGIFHASIQAVDGIAQLYQNSVGIGQDGGITDLRLGVLHEMAGGWIEAVAVHSRLDMTQDVDYERWQFPPMGGTPVLLQWSQSNHDVSRTNGLRTSYVHAIGDAPGWRIGVSATANHKTHPHLPDYDLASLPRDPGTTNAFDFGVGIAKELDGTRFAFDVNFVPAKSRTWAVSDTAILVPQNGGTVMPGSHTVDNEFVFSNLRMATGFGRQSSSGGWQVGLSVVANSYDLKQDNHVTSRTAKTQEGWTEWSPAWGFNHSFGDISLRYSGRLVMKGFPDLFVSQDDRVFAPSTDAGQDFLVPITSPVFMPDYTIFTNQFSVSVAVGHRRR